MLRRGKTSKRILWLRLAKRLRASGIDQRRTVVNAASSEHAQKLRWKTGRRVKVRTLRPGARIVVLGRLSRRRYRAVLTVKQIGGSRPRLGRPSA